MRLNVVSILESERVDYGSQRTQRRIKAAEAFVFEFIKLVRLKTGDWSFKIGCYFAKKIPGLECVI